MERQSWEGSVGVKAICFFFLQCQPVQPSGSRAERLLAVTFCGEGGPALTGPGPWVEQKEKAELLVKLLCVLPPVSHILSPSQILLTSKGAPRRAPLCRRTAKQQQSADAHFCCTSSSSRSAHKWQVAAKMTF